MSLVDQYYMKLWNSEWHKVTENNSREIKHSVELWSKLNPLSRKNEVISTLQT